MFIFLLFFLIKEKIFEITTADKQKYDYMFSDI